MQKSTHTRAYRLLRDRLVALRTSAGLTQRELAQRLKVPPSWVAKTELGERRLDVLEFCRIVRACGAAPEDVLREFSSAAKNSSQESRSDKGRSS